MANIKNKIIIKTISKDQIYNKKEIINLIKQLRTKTERNFEINFEQLRTGKL